MNRANLVKSKFPQEFDVASKLDPSDNKKYLLWIASQLNKGINENDLSSAVSFFHRNVQRFTIKDIYKYGFEDLNKSISSLEKSKKELKEEGITVINQNEEYKLIRIESLDAAIAYGANTKWCICSTKELDHFFNYIRDNDIYFAILKNDVKYAIIMNNSNQLNISLFNSSDRQIRSSAHQKIIKKCLSDIFGSELKPPKIRDYFNNGVNKNIKDPEFIKFINSNPKNAEIFLSHSHLYADFIEKIPDKFAIKHIGSLSLSSKTISTIWDKLNIDAKKKVVNKLCNLDIPYRGGYSEFSDSRFEAVLIRAIKVPETQYKALSKASEYIEIRKGSRRFLDAVNSVKSEDEKTLKLLEKIKNTYKKEDVSAYKTVKSLVDQIKENCISSKLNSFANKIEKEFKALKLEV
jgi:hypothetical protein